jgi:D-tyrosyl-tRNA(Tyr) deacylase
VGVSAVALGVVVAPIRYFQEKGISLRLVIQRVKQASVRVDDEIAGQIGHGLLIFLGVGEDDTEEDAGYLVEKVLGLRIFADDEGRFHRSVRDVHGSLLVVSQFTLWGDCRKGRRPSFSRSARPEKAEPLYELFIQKIAIAGLPVASGRFQEMMEVSLINDGPVTLLLDSRRQFW